MTTELSALVSAGLPLDRSLATLAELSDNLELRRIITEVLHAVQAGKSLTEALAQHPVFPSLYVNMIRAGEAGGFLDGVLQRLTEYLERAQLLRDEVRSALTYPILLTFAMSGSMMFLLVYVLPKFSSMFADLGRALPLSARLILGLSEGIRSYWWAGALGIAATVGGVRYSLRKPPGRYSLDQRRLGRLSAARGADDRGRRGDRPPRRDAAARRGALRPRRPRPGAAVHPAPRARAHPRHGPRSRLHRDLDAVGDLQRERSADVGGNASCHGVHGAQASRSSR